MDGGGCRGPGRAARRAPHRGRPAGAALLPDARSAASRFASRLDLDDGSEDICHIVRMGREHLALRALRGARAAGRPVVVTPNHHERWSSRPDPVWRRIYRDADLLVAMTAAEVELLADLGADRDRIVVTGVGPVLADGVDARRGANRASRRRARRRSSASSTRTRASTSRSPPSSGSPRRGRTRHW